MWMRKCGTEFGPTLPRAGKYAAMIRKLVSLSALSLLALACTKPAAMQPRVAPSEVKAGDVRKTKPHSDKADAESQDTPDLLRVSLSAADTPTHTDGTAHMRSVGDYVTYRFSGSYRSAPVVVSQRVAARSSDSLTMVMTVEDGAQVLRLRLTFDERPETRGEVLSVLRLEGGEQHNYGIAAYERLMSEIMLSADDNEAQLSTTSTSVEVANRSFAATRVRYRVRVGAHQAIMETISAPDFVWGDLGGSIRTLDGKLLYKVEIVDAGGSGFNAPQIAVQELDEDDFDYIEFE